MNQWVQLVGVLLIVAGSLLTLVTAIGMVRLDSLFARMHASTKPQVLGLVIMCLGLAGVSQRPRVAATLVLVVAMQLVVAPISAHMLGRATYRLEQVDREVLVLDEYAQDLARAAQHMDEELRHHPAGGDTAAPQEGPAGDGEPRRT